MKILIARKKVIIELQKEEIPSKSKCAYISKVATKKQWQRENTPNQENFMGKDPKWCSRHSAKIIAKKPTSF